MLPGGARVLSTGAWQFVTETTMSYLRADSVSLNNFVATMVKLTQMDSTH